MFEINEDVRRILEFDTILEKVRELSVSVLGEERLNNLSWLTDASLLEDELLRVTEFRDLIRFDDAFPLHAFEDLRPSLKRAEVVGAFLQPKELLDIVRFLTMMRRVAEYFKDRSDKYPLLQKRIKRIQLLKSLEQVVDRVVDSSGEIKDRASDTLYRLRQQIGKISSQIRKRLETMLRSMVEKGYTQEESLALRDGRLVIPMKETHRGRLDGVVIDQSASGATLFMEPLEILEKNNALRQLMAQERQEVERILKEVTAAVREGRDSILTNFEIAGELDSLAARARFSLSLDGEPATVVSNGTLVLKEARHPLLILRGTEDIVPLLLEPESNIRTLVITGPNAGGKTVALKTVGLLALMHQYGMHVPVKEGSALPLYTHVFADIGDRQSIEQDLSTFSSHIENLKTILDGADENSLILLDEIGSATDPAEGAALAEVVLRRLTQKGCFTVATTHMGALKVFAHEEEGIENASMAFDQETLRPTYRFQMGIPGSSYAFEIAERLGVPKDVVTDARHLVGDERGQLDRLILHLEHELQETHHLLEEAEIKESRLSGLVTLYQDKLDTLRKEGEAKQQAMVEEAKAVLKEANAAVENVVREIRERQADRDSIRSAKAEIEGLKDRIEAISREEPGEDLASTQEGDWVIWQGHEGKGRVVSEPDSSGRVLVQWDNVKLKVSSKDLLSSSAPKHKKSAGMSSFHSKSVSDEVDLRGLTVDEAVEVVERYLADARTSGLSTVRIIHGKGTGVLRKEIGRYLKGNRLVKSQRLGNWNEGDTGVTIAELK